MSVDGSPAPGLRLLLVDDHDRAREAFVRRIRSDARFAVVGATASLAEALAIVEGQMPHVALVDTRRQDGEGLKVVEALAALPERARPLIVAYTSFFDATDWHRARLVGAHEWLLKQIDVDALFTRLVDAARRKLPAARLAGISGPR